MTNSLVTYERQHKSNRAIIYVPFSSRGFPGRCAVVNVGRGDQRKYTYGYAPHYFLACTNSAALSSSSSSTDVHHTHRDLPDQTRHQRSAFDFSVSGKSLRENVTALRNGNVRVPPFPFYLQTINCYQQECRVCDHIIVILIQISHLQKHRIILSKLLGASHFHNKFTRVHVN